MANGRHPILAREGWAHITITGAVALAVHLATSWYWAIPFWGVFLFVLQFFRDPYRHIPSEPRGIVCPADGRVIVVDECTDPYLNRPARRVSIFMNIFDVHANRSPVEGKVMERWYHRGKFFNASLDKASAENERNTLWIQTDEGDDIVITQVAGLVARRILCYVHPGERVGQGERYGFIRFGSRVDLYMPMSCRVNVALGAKVKSGVQVIATLNNHQQ